MLMKRLFTGYLLLIGHVLFAQNFSGRIIDENRQIVPGVSIRNLSQNSFTTSDNNGIFELKDLHLEDTLTFRMLGYTSEMVLYTGENEKSIELKSSSISLEGIEVKPEMDAMQLFAEVNLEVSPVNSSQDLLRNVPGLFTGQHAGGGKAEQIFLRGFDIDHGTDLNISVDGIPVNMVSHAHGQGYSDLHFVIPETIEGIEFSKGSYKSDQGNFATAGSVGFKTKTRLDRSSASLEYGSFNTKRALGLFKLLGNKSNKSDAYIASEYIYSDGPFVSPQKFNRFNIMAKWDWQISDSEKLTATVSSFGSRWNASGQIPQRAVSSGLISRFGAIDDTEGGITSRKNASLTYDKSLGNHDFLQTRAYFTNYDFLLFSNFTFFERNALDGDQIKQAENRNLFGFETSVGKELNWNNTKIALSTSAGFRSDLIRNNELSGTKKKNEILERIYLGNIDETNAYMNICAGFELNKIRIIPGLRIDQFNFNYLDKLSEKTLYQKEKSVLVSPKLSFIIQPSAKAQYFLKTGTGYHSNDSRAVIFRRNDQVLPRSYGADLGTILKPSEKILLNATLWFLYLDQEFVYVGDEGIVESSGKTRRFGLDFGIRTQLGRKLFFDTDITYSHARSIEHLKGQNYIPLAPAFTYTGGISLLDWKGISGGIKTRILGKRPATEDYSLVARGYWVTDVNLSYRKGDWNLGFQIQNLFNARWNETQFATTSKLRNELNSVREIHFTPGTPLAVKTSLTYRF